MNFSCQVIAAILIFNEFNYMFIYFLEFLKAPSYIQSVNYWGNSSQFCIHTNSFCRRLLDGDWLFVSFCYFTGSIDVGYFLTRSPTVEVGLRDSSMLRWTETVRKEWSDRFSVDWGMCFSLFIYHFTNAANSCTPLINACPLPVTRL